MTLIHQIIGLEAPKRGDVGMELEVEGSKPLPQINEKKWRSKEDGSLRGYSMEYVSSEPLALKRAEIAIQYLCEKLNPPDLGVIRESPRTSFHVHNNVSGMTPTQVWTSACAYWLLENVLVKFCDDGAQTREGNCFCLRLTDAEASLPFLLKDLKYPHSPFSQVDSDRIRYMGLNLSAVRRFGSLEVRTMRGTIDPAVLYQWTVANHSLVSKAPQFFRDPAHLLDEHHRLGSEAIMNMLLSPEFVPSLKVDDWKEAIEESAGLLCEIAYFHDWGKYGEKVDKAWAEPQLRVGNIGRRINHIFDDAPPPPQGGNDLAQFNLAMNNAVPDAGPRDPWADRPWRPLPLGMRAQYQAIGYEVRLTVDGAWQYR